MHQRRHYPTSGDGGQGEAVSVPLADGALVRAPGSGHSDETLASLLTLSDVMSTGHHAAVCADVRPGDTVAVVGDGAVGLCGVLAAKRRGADRIIALSRHPDRQALAQEIGATDIVEQHGDEAIQAIMELTDGVGVDATLECVGTGQSFRTAIAIARPGSMVAMSASRTASSCRSARCSRATRASAAASRRRAPTSPSCCPTSSGQINPGWVLDYATDLERIADAYAATDERRAIKSLVRVGTIR